MNKKKADQIISDPLNGSTKIYLANHFDEGSTCVLDDIPDMNVEDCGAAAFNEKINHGSVIRFCN